MQSHTWDDSVAALRQAYCMDLPAAQSLLLSEIEMRWSDARIGSYEIVPLRRQGRLMIGEEEYVHQRPYSRLLVLQKSNGGKADFFSGVHLGPAISSIMSFVMRCSIVSYNGLFPPLHTKKDGSLCAPELTGAADDWAESWKDILGLKPGVVVLKGLRENLFSYIPSPEEEQYLIETTGRVYEILMKIDEEIYHSIIGAMRLYQLAFHVARVDFSLAYSLLVAAIDAASSSWRAKVRLRDIDPEDRLVKLMEGLRFDKQLQKAVKNLITYHESLTERFSNFIAENLPKTFWEGDYSISKELDLLADSISRLYWSGEYLRDIADSMPESQRRELLRRADEEKKRYWEFLKEKPERKKHRWAIDVGRRKWMMGYLRTHLDRVLRNTFRSRSELVHCGRGFPKISLKKEFVDWIPDVFEEDYREFIREHSEHKWNYSVDEKGRILRSCSCGDRKEVTVLLGIRVFERMVHDSLLNYLLQLNT